MSQGSLDLPTTEPAQTLLDEIKVEVVADQNKEGGWRVNPGDIEVLDVKQVSGQDCVGESELISQAANGRILYLNGVIKV